MALLLGTLAVLIDDLDALLARRQRQAMKPQRLAPRMALGRHQPLVRNDASLDIVEDEGGIHEHRAVVAHEGRRLHDRIDRAKLVEGAKDGERLVLEGDAHELHRDRDAAHVGRIEHADELHAMHDNRSAQAIQC